MAPRILKACLVLLRSPKLQLFGTLLGLSSRLGSMLGDRRRTWMLAKLPGPTEGSASGEEERWQNIFFVKIEVKQSVWSQQVQACICNPNPEAVSRNRVNKGQKFVSHWINWVRVRISIGWSAGVSGGVTDRFSCPLRLKSDSPSEVRQHEFTLKIRWLYSHNGANRHIQLFSLRAAFVQTSRRHQFSEPPSHVLTTFM